MQTAPTETDFLVIGAGVAGLRAAVELAPAGRVVVLAKREVTDSATQYAQGGIAAALGDEDEIGLHLQDTLNAGDGLCDPDAVKVLVEEGPERIEELIQWGTEFDRDGTNLAFGREGAIAASAVLLATGGVGQLYKNTTNPRVATGDGVAMAFRAGAEASDMEFIQFHPTALYLKNAPRFLLSEALRGEGAYLRNGELLRFMPKYHEMAELAPRDVVARAIVHELEVSPMKDPVVYLDLTHLNEVHVKARFPRIHSTCLQFNIDIATDLIPIRPAAHYSMGGVRTDLDARTSVAGLSAAGEVASTGVHGANRLASNSLLEGLVFGARAGKKMRDELRKEPAKIQTSPHAAYSNGPVQTASEEIVREIQDLMWQDVGVVRTGQGMKRAIERLTQLEVRVAHPHTRRAWEARNLQTVGLLVARSALARQESRGAHYRTDYPDHNDAKFRKHSLISREAVRFA